MQRIPFIIRSLLVVGSLSPALGFSKHTNLTILGDEAKVSFIAKTKPVPLTIEGSGTGLAGALKLIDATHTEGEVSFPLKNLSTQLAKRDEHMQKHLDCEHFAIAKFTPTVLPWSDPSLALTQAVSSAPFEGKMTLRGVEKPIKGKVSSKPGSQGKVEFTFVFDVNILDFSIPVPSYLGVSMKEIVEVTVNAPAKLEVL